MARSGSGRGFDLDRGGDRRIVEQAGDLAGQGTFEATLVGHPKPKRCAAKHEKVKLRFEGTQQSDDARLAGRLEIQAVAVVNTDPKSDGYRYGYAKGTVVLRKTYSPGTTFKGEFVAVLEPDGGGEGFVTGETRGKDAVHLLANFNFDKDSPATSAASSARTPRCRSRTRRRRIRTRRSSRTPASTAATATAAVTATATAWRPPLSPSGPRRRTVAGVSLRSR